MVQLSTAENKKLNQSRIPIRKYLRRMIPRPGVGHWWADLSYLLVVITFQVSILPSIFNNSYIDLLTPWLIYNFIFLRWTSSMPLGLIGALALERNGTHPMGMYMCIYWIIGMVILSVRVHISWRNMLPWLAVFTLAQIWLLVFELLVYIVTTNNVLFITWSYLLGILTRIFFTLSLSVLFYVKLSSKALEEHGQ